MADPLRALVVDDSELLRKSIVHALEGQAGMACVEARDGAEALKRLTEGSFDLVVTDINMPVMDGLKLIGHLRRLPAHQKLPIVVVTTLSGAEDRRRALSLGASAYLTKPFRPEDLLAAVRGLLPKL